MSNKLDCYVLEIHDIPNETVVRERRTPPNRMLKGFLCLSEVSA